MRDGMVAGEGRSLVGFKPQYAQASAAVVGCKRDLGRVVARSVVDDENFANLRLAQGRANRTGDRSCGILGRNDDAYRCLA